MPFARLCPRINSMNRKLMPKQHFHFWLPYLPSIQRPNLTFILSFSYLNFKCKASNCTFTIKQPTNNLNIRILIGTSLLYLIRHASVILIVCLHLSRRMPTSERCWKKKYWHTVGSNQQPLDYCPNVLPTELRRQIGRVGFY